MSPRSPIEDLNGCHRNKRMPPTTVSILYVETTANRKLQPVVQTIVYFSIEWNRMECKTIFHQAPEMIELGE